MSEQRKAMCIWCGHEVAYTEGDEYGQAMAWNDLIGHDGSCPQNPTAQERDRYRQGFDEVSRAHQTTLTRVAELEDELAYIKNNHKESSLWPSAIIESDQKMADGRPAKMALVTNWCIRKIKTNARKGK